MVCAEACGKPSKIIKENEANALDFYGNRLVSSVSWLFENAAKIVTLKNVDEFLSPRRSASIHRPIILQHPIGMLTKILVADEMTSNVITCDFNQPITSILELMDEDKVHHVPITENGELCGIINMLDLVNYRLAELEFEATSLKEYVAGKA